LNSSSAWKIDEIPYNNNCNRVAVTKQLKLKQKQKLTAVTHSQLSQSQLHCHTIAIHTLTAVTGTVTQFSHCHSCHSHFHSCHRYSQTHNSHTFVGSSCMFMLSHNPPLQFTHDVTPYNPEFRQYTAPFDCPPAEHLSTGAR
jgi:hypothetical protein